MKKISTAQCKNRLAILWVSGSLGLLILLVIQTIFGHYGKNTSEVWGWFLPIVMPTLSLIITVLVMDALSRGAKIKTVSRVLYIASFTLSTFYLILTALAILLQPFTRLPAIELMRQSNFWLGPLQGLVAASLGAFFIKKEQG